MNTNKKIPTIIYTVQEVWYLSHMLDPPNQDQMTIINMISANLANWLLRGGSCP